MSYLPEPPYRHGATPKTGVVLVNLGTPEAATPAAVRAYLKEFLSDPRVVEIPRLAWWLILNGVILNVRPKQSAKKYARIWTAAGSPLRVHTDRQAKLLRDLLGEQLGSPFEVAWAMRYGTPSIAAALAGLKVAGCDKILVLPLYPQYAASTTGATYDAVARYLTRVRNVPSVRLVRDFHDHPAYIAALAASVREYWAEHGKPERLVMSFHGLPQYTLERGDPYHCECHVTARLLAEALGLKTEEWQLTFQSRFGRTQWLQPYTSVTLSQLARQGKQRVDVVCPGFVSDCLETLEEIGIEAREAFLTAGGRELHLIPCLNERPDWIQALAALACSHLGDWVSKDWDARLQATKAQASAQRATAMGGASQ